MPPPFEDDKAPICIPFILKHLEEHRQISAANATSRPLIVGLNGLQGVGKTTLVTLLTTALREEGIPTLVCSIDDFYLTHDDQVSLARRFPENKLWQHRGEPGTHDIPLATSFLASILQNQSALLPQYDKAAFSGQGDRLPQSQWKPVNHPDQQQHRRQPTQVVILEGWCVGFRPLAPEQLLAKHRAPNRTLQQHALQHLQQVNNELRNYDAITSLFDLFVHIDSEDLGYVYDWRTEQEDHLREARGDPGAGMTKEQVIKFVDAYFPAYELYTDGVRQGVITGKPGSQLRLIVGRDRKVKEVKII